MSNLVPANSTDLPIAVFANLGTSDNLVPVKCFATFKEAQAWMEQQQKERPGYFMIDAADDSAYYE